MDIYPPHTHRPLVHREWDYRNGGLWLLDYGDTTVTVSTERLFKIIPTDKQVQRALAKAIRKHDNGSKTPKTAPVPQMPYVPQGKWASEVLVDK